MSTTSDGGRLRRALDVHPELWVSWRPNGAGLTKPHHFREMVEVAWDNRAHPHYAWQVLSKGVCDGCALGVAGFHDWTLDGVHLCTTRLRMLETNTADAFDPVLLEDVSLLADRTPADLRALGRLGYPMRRRRGEPGFRRISWDEAAAVSADALAAAAPERIALYVTSKGLTNETYYVAGKAARALGIASVDSAARVCHAPSTVGLKTTIGVAASTCSLQDVLETDCIVIWGANPANNQPVFTKYLHLAKANGARIVVVNPYLEPGLERYWVPSIPESALFGTKLCDLHVPVRPGVTSPSPTPCASDSSNAATSTTPSSPPTPKGGTSWPRPWRRSRSSTCWRPPASTPPRWRRSSTATPGPTPPSCSGRWASPRTATPSRRCRAWSTWRWLGATSGATAPA
ncbi:MAG: molybdopterin-dependent oxidoreductase [Acidimicrobiales bacterium]